MANRVDTASYGLQAANRKAVVYCVFSQAQIFELLPRDDAVLPLRQPSDERVGPFGRPRISTRPPQPAYFAG